MAVRVKVASEIQTAVDCCCGGGQRKTILTGVRQWKRLWFDLII